MTIRLEETALKKLHAFCVAESAKGDEIVSLSRGVSILIERIPDAVLEVAPRAAAKKKAAKRSRVTTG